MTMSPGRWEKFSESQFPWEREALEYIRTNLPDHEPYRAWTNFEFIADDGTINEIDLLVVTPMGFFLVEIKSKPGLLTGDSSTWTWKHTSQSGHDRTTVIDNPLLLCNRKAKKLASMLKRQSAFNKHHCPYLDAIVFCSAEDLVAHLHGNASMRIAFRDSTEKSRPGIVGALKRRELPGLKQNVQQVNKPQSKAIGRALEQIGIRASQSARRVGDYLLSELLYESVRDSYQDFLATHSNKKVKGTFRVRIYNEAPSSSKEAKAFLRKAAEREFEICSELNHDAILQAKAFTEHELGPALVFQHYDDCVQLDHYLHSKADTLSIEYKLSMIRQLAEAINYAHGKHIIHRTLCPQSILVREIDKEPKLIIFNWMAGHHDETTEGTFTRTCTLHPEQLVSDESMAYLSPEAISEPNVRGSHFDVFSLGAITYHIISGQPPASNFHELTQKLEQDKGLEILKVVDTAPPALSELIHFCTALNYQNRYDSIDEFLKQLEKYEDDLTTPDDDFRGNPLDATVKDRLKGGYVVKSRLGKGSTAVAFLVEKNGKEQVLKLANKEANNKRIESEYNCLKKLDHELIVEAYDLIEIDGLKGFTMKKAGKDTLAEELRQLGRLQLEFLERYGEDLLQIIDHLEKVGISHRDLKPDNIGIGSVKGKTRYRLQLFDFSLTDVKLENILAGTPPYRDPFLSNVDRNRWDSSAERFSAAITLHEMAAGTVPKWEGGYHSGNEATIESESFESAIRAPLTKFFKKALSNTAHDRFDNAELMLRAWRKLFRNLDTEGTVSTTQTFTSDGATEFPGATEESELASLGISSLAASAFEKLHLVTVKQLLKTSVYKIKHIRGTGLRTQKEIMALYDLLKERFSDIDQEESVSDGTQPGMESIDVLVSELERIGASKKNKLKALHALFGLSSVEELGEWPSMHDVSAALSCNVEDLGAYLQSARSALKKMSSFTAVRRLIIEILEQGSVMLAQDMAQALLTARGSVQQGPVRMKLAMAVLRAAIEAEDSLEEPCFTHFRLGGKVYVSVSENSASYVRQLGETADSLADQDPLASSEHALRELRRLVLQDGLADIRRDRDLLRLASHASAHAAVSSRFEIYPRNMDAFRALTLAQGSICGVPQLTEEDIKNRISGRYPEAEALPGRPTLDQWLNDIGLELIWDSGLNAGKGAYVYPRHDTLTMTSSGALSSYHAESKEILDAKRFHQSLNTELKSGGYLVLTCPPKQMGIAQERLTNAFDLRIFDMDKIIIAAMKQAASEFEVDWSVALEADATTPPNEDWQNLNSLVESCTQRIESAFAQVTEPILMINAGLLTRYGQLSLLGRLRDRALVRDGINSLWLLVSSHGDTPYPILNGQPVPVLGSSQFKEIPQSWIYDNAFDGGVL